MAFTKRISVPEDAPSSSLMRRHSGHWQSRLQSFWEMEMISASGCSVRFFRTAATAMGTSSGLLRQSWFL